MHKDSIKACYMFSDREPVMKDYGTQTPQLRLLSYELQFLGIFDVVIESTGIYWIPLYELLQQQGVRVVIGFELLDLF